ncbi:MAG: holin family protein [Bacillales bacterium]|nr:holin family protein [Bacillales bacterium]
MENIIKTIVAIGGALASYFFGGWSALLSILLTFIVIDYISGVMAAAVKGQLSSEVGLIGIAKKVSIFAIVAVAHLVDTALGDSHVLRDAAIFFYLANEALSVIENIGVIGLPIPEQLKNAVEVLKQKGDDKK